LYVAAWPGARRGARSLGTKPYDAGPTSADEPRSCARVVLSGLVALAVLALAMSTRVSNANDMSIFVTRPVSAVISAPVGGDGPLANLEGPATL
jgi:hypothetical protein